MADPEEVEADLRTIKSVMSMPENGIPLAAFITLVYIDPVEGHEHSAIQMLGVASIGRNNLIGAAFLGLTDWAVHPETMDED
jgi:hypothetical protein